MSKLKYFVWANTLIVLFSLMGSVSWAQESVIEEELFSTVAQRKYMKLASWNIRILSNSRTDEELKQIGTVAKKFDLIAIVELRHEEVLRRLVNIMNDISTKHYSYVVSSPVGPGRFAASAMDVEDVDEEDIPFGILGHQELYGFIYEDSFIKCTVSPRIYNDNFFFRKPGYASFRAGKFDFTVIAIHVIWGKSVGQRREEIKRLNNVFTKIREKGSENDIILVGDFNRNPEDDLSWGPLKSQPSMVQLFQAPQKSMVVDSNLYDNILFQSVYVKEYSLDKGIVRFDEDLFNNDDKKAIKAVSDHRPVWAKFRITGRDDD